MKIIHIHQYYNDGMGYQENILPKYQALLGHDVILLTSTLSNGFNKQARKQVAGDYEDNNFIVRRIDITGEFKNRFVNFKNLNKELETLNPDYIFHHSPTAPSLMTVCEFKKRNPNVKIVVDNHADLTISGKNIIWKKLYYNFYWSKIIKKYDDYISCYFGVTPSRCNFLFKELGVNKDKIRLLPIGTEGNNITDYMTKEEFFDKYKIKVNSETIVFTHGGKITKEKQINRIINAFSKLKENNVKLVLFGTIEDDYIYDLIKKDNRIIHIGWLNRENTLLVLKHSDIGIWNTQHTTLLEDAVGMGLPLIIRYYGSTSHLIDNSGLYIYEGSEREIFDKFQFILNNRDILHTFKINAKSLSKQLCYSRIAEESIKYAYDLKPQVLHQKFMDSTFSDFSYNNFDKINKK